MIFTALLSVVFLGQRIRGYMWLGMSLVVAGLVLVGLSDIVFHTAGQTGKDVNSIITGTMETYIIQYINIMNAKDLDRHLTLLHVVYNHRLFLFKS